MFLQKFSRCEAQWYYVIACFVREALQDIQELRQGLNIDEISVAKVKETIHQADLIILTETAKFETYMDNILGGEYPPGEYNIPLSRISTCKRVLMEIHMLLKGSEGVTQEKIDEKMAEALVDFKENETIKAQLKNPSTKHDNLLVIYSHNLERNMSKSELLLRANPKVNDDKEYDSYDEYAM